MLAVFVCSLRSMKSRITRRASLRIGSGSGVAFFAFASSSSGSIQILVLFTVEGDRSQFWSRKIIEGELVSLNPKGWTPGLPFFVSRLLSSLVFHEFLTPAFLIEGDRVLHNLLTNAAHVIERVTKFRIGSQHGQLIVP